MTRRVDWLHAASWLAIFAGAWICFAGIVLLIAWLT